MNIIMNILEFFNTEELKMKKVQKNVPIVESESESESDEIDEVVEVEAPHLRTETIMIRDFNQLPVRLSMKGSLLVSATIEGVIIQTMSWRGIINEIYRFIGNVEQIKMYTKIPIVDGKYTEKGYKWIYDLDISFQDQTGDRSLQEIFSQVLENGFSFDLKLVKDSKEYIFTN